MSYRRKHPSHLAVGVCLLAALATLTLFGGDPAYTDDRDLLRFSTANPYLFILLDTSTSMNLKIGTLREPVPGYGDHPESRLYAAKEALFEVLAPLDDVSFGFATFNQNELRVESKHWLYYWDGQPENSAGLGGWPAGLGWPTPDIDGIAHYEDIGATGIPNRVLTTASNGDIWALGPHADGSKVGDGVAGTLGVAGSCQEPLDLAVPWTRQRVNAFPKLGDGTQTTKIWIKGVTDRKTYLVEIKRAVDKPDGHPNLSYIGDPDMSLSIKLALDANASCADGAEATVVDGKARFLQDPDWKSYIMVDRPRNYEDPIVAYEFYPNLWEAPRLAPDGSVDASQFGDVINTAICEDNQNPHPFSGHGWESNYDGEAVHASDLDPSDDDRDAYCVDDPADPSAEICVDLKFNPTLFDPDPPLDEGDMLPFDWRTVDSDHKEDLLLRLAPNCVGLPCANPDFGVSNHLSDDPAADVGVLAPARGRPLIASGETHMAKAMLDFRCWYMGIGGTGNAGKCADTPYLLNAEEDEEGGWSEVACDQDPDYGCRRPFLILITDGLDTCPGENPAADAAAMYSHSGVQTWALNLGEQSYNPDGSKNNSAPCLSNAKAALNSITNLGKGECIDIANKADLRKTLQDILGIIREQAAVFASAAVPTVRTTVAQSVYISSFLPLNELYTTAVDALGNPIPKGASVWDGHLRAYLRPIPLNSDGTPNIEPDRSLNPNFLWDAGTVLEGQVNNADYLDLSATDKRRVFYSAYKRRGEWARHVRGRMLFDPPPGDPNGSDAEATWQHYDLWRGLGLIPEETPDKGLTDEDAASTQDLAEFIIDETLRLKTAKRRDGGTERYVLGDIFHSTPVVVDAPVNTIYFAQDLGADQDEDCTADDNLNRGYRCFWNRSQRRRRIVLVGANDGMLHAFNGGVFVNDDTRDDDQTYTTGSGHELFAYMPREAMPAVASQATGVAHQFSVDGSSAVADVFIDPKHQIGSSGFPLEAEREWRTVVLMAMREGGKSVLALDITQPDHLQLVDGEFIPVTTPAVDEDGNANGGDYLPGCLESFANDKCGVVKYPAPLWEFFDSTNDANLVTPPSIFGECDPATDASCEVPVLMDEDGNQAGIADPALRVGDLGFTWSNPTFGRIRLTEQDASGQDVTVDKHVAVFGGGMDPTVAGKGFNPHDPPAAGYTGQGNWLYMVDIETGQTIYKRRLVGATPSEAAAVDTDLDAYLDRIYVGTLAGYMYRVDLSPVVVDDAPKYPELQTVPVTDINGEAHDARRITVGAAPDPDCLADCERDADCVADCAGDSACEGACPPDATCEAECASNWTWRPRIIFDTYDPDTLRPRPIYLRPAVIFAGKLGLSALAFGTGDREDLWNTNLGQEGRFYLMVDDTDYRDPATLPLDETDLRSVAVDDPAVLDADGDPADLMATNGGWVLHLDPLERVINDAFSLLGITFFSSFQPMVSYTTARCDPVEDPTCDTTDGVCGTKDFDEGDTTNFCAKTGTSRIFLVSTINANPMRIDLEGNPTRFTEAATFVTNPYTEVAGAGSGGSGAADTLSPEAQNCFDMLKDLMPSACRFTNQRVDIRINAADTTNFDICGIPICLMQRNWKELSQ